MKKVRLLKDLPGIDAGTEIEQGEYDVFKHPKTTLTLNYIKQYPEFFEVIEDEEPVWAKEVWGLDDKNYCIVFPKHDGRLYLSTHAVERKEVIAAAPEMWRFVKKIANSHSFYHFEAKELLKKIGK